MIVNPAADALVRDPTTGRAIEAGAEINETEPYWARLLVDGDIVPAADTAAAEPTALITQPQDEVIN